MILFTNGCSWTFGGGLNLDELTQEKQEQRLASVWPHHLGKLLEAEKTVNLAMGCGSNPRILRTTLNWILEQTPEDLAKTVAVIQWSEYFRYEYYTPADFSNKYENLPKRWARAKAGLAISIFEPDTRKSLARVESRLSTYTDIEAMYTHIAHCDALGALFKWLDNGLTTWNYERIDKLDIHPNFTGHRQLAEIMYYKMKETE